MVRLTTTYDNEINKKVFLVRGDEAYAKTTNCELDISSEDISFGEMQGVKIATVTINLYRTFGSAQLILYDGEIPLKSWHITSGVSTKSITDLYLAYNVTHELWAEYKPLNHQCLGSKSKKFELFEPVPYDLQINISSLNYTAQINSDTTSQLQFELYKGSKSITKNATYSVYVDDERVIHTTTNKNEGQFTLPKMTEGKRKITIEVESSDEWYGDSIEFEILVGYHVELISYPGQFINGTSNHVEVHVRNYNDELMNDGYVAIYKKGAKDSLGTFGTGLLTEGVAIVDVAEIPSTGEYFAEYLESNSESKIFTLYNPEGLTITANKLMIGLGDINTVSVTLNDGRSGVPVMFDIKGNKTSVTSVDGKSSYNYTGVGAGDINITATVGEMKESIKIQDVLAYWSSDTNHSSEFDQIVTIDEGDMLEYPNFLQFRDIAKVTGSVTGDSYGIIEFNETKFLENDKIVQFTLAKNPLNVTSLEFSIGTKMTVPSRSIYPKGGIPYYTDAYSTDTFEIPSSKLKTGSIITVGGGKVMVDDEELYLYYTTPRFNSVNIKQPKIRFNTKDGGELYIKDVIYKK